MKDFLIIMGLILIGVILFFGIPYLIYFVLKKLGKPRIGKLLGIGLLTTLSFLSVYIVFEDQFFFKNSARKELKQLNIVLDYDFEILKNESGGFTDYYHIFELKISDKDLNKLIEKFKSKSNPIVLVREHIENNVWKEIRVDSNKNILTYEYIIN